MISSAVVIQKRGRDAKRHSDLRSIQSALQQYYSDQFSYPTSITKDNPITSEGKTYLNKVPSDPRTGNQEYVYEAYPPLCDNSNTKCVDYCLYAKLESELANCSSNPSLKTCSNACSDKSVYNLEVTRP